MKNLILFIFISFTGLKIKSQCEVKSKIGFDQTMYFYLASELFFYNDVKSLKGNVTTDKNNYFLRFFPKPFPSKEDGKKLDHTLTIELMNDTVIELESFDIEYRSKDTSLALMYILPRKLIPLFMEHEVKSVVIDLGDESGPRHYDFILHKATLREQLNCLNELK